MNLISLYVSFGIILLAIALTILRFHRLQSFRHIFKEQFIIIKTNSPGKVISEIIGNTCGTIQEVSAYVNPLNNEITIALESGQRISEIKSIIGIHKINTIIVHYADNLIDGDPEMLANFKGWAKGTGTKIILLAMNNEETTGFSPIVNSIVDKYALKSRRQHIRKIVLLLLFVGTTGILSQGMIIQKHALKKIDAINTNDGITQLMVTLYMSDQCTTCIDYIKRAGLNGHMKSAWAYLQIKEKMSREYFDSIPKPKTRRDIILYQGIADQALDDGVITENEHELIELPSTKLNILNYISNTEVEPMYYNKDYIYNKM